jgi:hypothetical protein
VWWGCPCLDHGHPYPRVVLLLLLLLLLLLWLLWLLWLLLLLAVCCACWGFVSSFIATSCVRARAFCILLFPTSGSFVPLLARTCQLLSRTVTALVPGFVCCALCVLSLCRPYEFFVSRVVANLHVVVSMDPTHPRFSVRCESNPALYNKCTVRCRACPLPLLLVDTNYVLDIGHLRG